MKSLVWSSLAAAGLLLFGSPAVAQQVTGTVTSAEESERVLGGVTVTVAGSNRGTLTNAEGRYSIEAPSLNDTLVFTSIGFQERRVPINGRTTVNVSLEPSAVVLDELVVVGYGTQQRRDVTGSVATVESEKITEAATPSVEQALQGRVAGVQVTPASGEPGAGAVVRIRGVGTLNNASPLYVVDGMLLDDITFLNPNDIESVEVLKDASATAIYGSRGANGVIIVTTKKGSAGQGTSFSLDAYTGMQRVQNPIELTNARQYAILANELAENQGLANPYFANPEGLGEGTDWQEEIFQAAPTHNVQLSARGGSDRVRYYFSGNLVEQQGIVPKSDFTRVTFRLNNDYDLTDRFRLGHNLNFAYTDDQRAPNVVGALYRADPTIAPRNEAGEFNDANLRASAGNPAASVFYANNAQENGRLVGNLFAEAELPSNLTLRSSLGLDYSRQDFRSFAPQFFVSPTQQNQVSSLNVETAMNRSWLWENTLDYNYSTDRHRIAAVAGITAQSAYNEVLGGSRTNLVGESSNLWYLNAGDAEGQTNFNSASDWRMLSYLFRTNYTLLDRYLFTASLRVDGSSRFGAENRYGWFPSLAVGWNLAEEAFLRDSEAISALKLRASWGQIGNDKIGAYPATAVVAGNLNAVFGRDPALHFGATPIALANPDVRWERTTQSNVGADMAFFDGRLEATVEWYSRLTDGILVRVPIPDYIGVSTEPFVNAAEVLNSGVEGSLTWNANVGELNFALGANGSLLNNEVKSLGGGREEILGGGLGNEISFTTRTVPGRPIGSFWGYRVEGVFQTQDEIANAPTRGNEQPGDLRYADLNGDGQITEADKTFLGSPIPDFIYGFNADVAWRNFDLSANFSGQSGNEVFNGKKAVRFGVENFETSYLDRWTGPGTSNTEPRVTTAGHNYQASERFIEDGSFLKLQSIQLGYRLSDGVAERLSLGGARVYVSGTNLFTLTDYSGYTPELLSNSVISSGIDLGVYPPVRTITAGVEVSF